MKQVCCRSNSRRGECGDLHAFAVAGEAALRGSDVAVGGFDGCRGNAFPRPPPDPLLLEGTRAAARRPPLHHSHFHCHPLNPRKGVVSVPRNRGWLRMGEVAAAGCGCNWLVVVSGQWLQGG